MSRTTRTVVVTAVWLMSAAVIGLFLFGASGAEAGDDDDGRTGDGGRERTRSSARS